MKCLICSGELTGRQKMYCSIPCRNSANGKKSGGHNRQGHTKACENCGNSFPIPASRMNTARACSRVCLGEIQSRERKGTMMEADAPNWKGGIQTYRRYRKDACERCGATEKLLVHHRNENRYDSSIENLETLCSRCHAVHHDFASHLVRVTS